MKLSFLPYQHLFDELQIAMIPVAKRLPVVQSMLKWAKGALDRNESPTALGWMITTESHLSYPSQIEQITLLRESIRELGRPLKELMLHILEFSSFKPIEKSLISLHKFYSEIPPIDNEIHLLYLSTDLFQNEDVLLKLILFTDKLIKLQEASALLKKAIIEELLQHLSTPFPTESKLKFPNEF